MTNAYDSVSFANNRQDRVAVPAGHNPQIAPMASWDRTARPVNPPTKPVNTTINIKPKAYARFSNRATIDQVKQPALLNRTGKTIQPLSQQMTQVASAMTHNQPSSQPVVDNEFKPTVPVYKTSQSAEPVRKASQPVAAPAYKADQPAIDRQAILRRAAEVRMQARKQAEARARADALARHQEQVKERRMAEARRQAAELIAKRRQQQTEQAKQGNLTAVLMRTPSQSVESPATEVAMATPLAATTQPAVANNVLQQNNSAPAGDVNQAPSANLNTIAPGGEAAVIQQDNLWQRIAGAKITFNFKINKQRIFAVLRYLAVAVIIAASGYLAWDTYVTNKSVKDTFSGGNAASAMSISGTNPATADQTAISQQQRAAYTVPADQPRYIYIPAIGVNARVMSVGVNSKGNIDTPANLNDTAWYDGSAKPGMDGQVFIDGHTSFNNSIPAAFNDLPKLKAGDIITIEKGNGEKINYRVTDIQTKNANDVNMGEALNPPAGADKGLTLMTCTGTFNYRSQTADQRLIVYAVQE